MNIYNIYISIYRFICFIVLTFLVFFFKDYFAPYQTWFIWAALFPIHFLIKDRFFRWLIVFLFMACASVFFSILINSAVYSMAFKVIYLFIITFICVLISEQKKKYFIALFIVNVFAILAADFMVSGADNFQRAMAISAGFMLSLIVQATFLILYYRNELYILLNNVLIDFKQLNNEFFYTLTQNDYFDDLYLYEKRLHLLKGKFIQSLSDLFKTAERASLNKEKEVWWHGLIKKLDTLYSIFIDYSQIRRRVSDHTIFSVCNKEFKRISDNINECLSELMIFFRDTRESVPDVTKLDRAINDLDDLYESVLQVTAREPLVILLFIQSLKNLAEEIKSLIVYVKKDEKIKSEV